MYYALPEPDPQGLIREAYSAGRIDICECRALFLDWTLGLPAGLDPAAALVAMIERHAGDAPDHPMSTLLFDSLSTAPRLRRRAERRLERQTA